MSTVSPKSKRSLKRSRDRDAKIAIGSPIFFFMVIGIAISIFDKDWDRDRDRDLDFGDWGHALLICKHHFYEHDNHAYEKSVERSLQRFNE